MEFVKRCQSSYHNRAMHVSFSIGRNEQSVYKTIVCLNASKHIHIKHKNLRHGFKCIWNASKNGIRHETELHNKRFCSPNHPNVFIDSKFSIHFCVSVSNVYLLCNIHFGFCFRIRKMKSFDFITASGSNTHTNGVY